MGPVSLYYEDVHQVVLEHGHRNGLHIGAFQMVLTHEQGLDRLTIRIAVPEPGRVPVHASSELTQAMFVARPLLGQLIGVGKAHPLAIEWVGAAELAVNPRTGKLRRMVDQRRDER